MKNLYEETISSEMIYKGKVVNLRRDKARLQNGSEVTREVVEHPGGVAVAALVWVAVSYRISCSIFDKQELS